MKKLKIDPQNCIGCGTCVLIAPDFFKMDESRGKAVIKKQPDKITEEIKEAITSCPTGAIILQSINKKTLQK